MPRKRKALPPETTPVTVTMKYRGGDLVRFIGPTSRLVSWDGTTRTFMVNGWMSQSDVRDGMPHYNLGLFDGRPVWVCEEDLESA